MRSKKNKETKKYALGGTLALGAGALQAGLGAYQMIAGQQLAKDIKEAPTARPSEYAEMLKLARQADLERKRLEELNRTLSTGISATQQAGGRAVIGALPAMVQAGDIGAQNILAQRQAAQLAALQQAAGGAEREISREMAREQQQRMAAQAAAEGGLQNIAGALGGVGKAAALGAFDKNKSEEELLQPTIDTVKQETLASLGKTAEARSMDARSLARLQEELLALNGEDMIPLLNSGGMMTGGKFSHKTNPIDIVQKGKKIGEMTGGEVILNPAQQKKLSQESAYFRSLLKKFNKQK